jgi:hypothetical protein
MASDFFGIIIILLLCLYSPSLCPGCVFSFLILHTFGRIPWTGDQSVARPLPTHGTAQTQNKRTQTSMPRGEFEPTIPMFEWARTAHAFDRVAAVIGLSGIRVCYLQGKI